jgi:outer membrane protein assembly factor BamE (lipoprotein component of BamABCDE complex)
LRLAARYVNARTDARRKMRVPHLGITIIHRHKRGARFALALAGALALASCGSMTETLQRGYVLPEGALEQIPIGATQEQVLIVLGTPSTVATVNGEAFYYISQKAQRKAAFMPYETVDQRVIAVYFDKDRKVTRLANYGLKDGRVFDFLSQTTPTGGAELSYLRNIFKNIGVGMIHQ